MIDPNSAQADWAAKMTCPQCKTQFGLQYIFWGSDPSPIGAKCAKCDCEIKPLLRK